MANLFDRLVIDADRSARLQSRFDDDDDDLFPDVLPALDAVLPPPPALSRPIPKQSTPLPKKRAAPAGTAAAAVVPPPKLQKSTKVTALPATHDAASRNSALLQWSAILAQIAECCSMSLHVGSEPTPSDLEPYFALKRTGTLNLHASAWKLFLRYAEVKSLDLQAFSEGMAFEYLRHLDTIGAPPSRAGAFLRACNFTMGCCGLYAGDVIRISPRFRGAAAMSLARRLPRRQRDTLLTRWIIGAEAEVVLASNHASDFTDQEAEVLGFALFCTHTRSRCADAAKLVSEPTVDTCEEDDGMNFSFVEASTTGAALKTGNSAAKANLVFPVVGLAKGLSGECWAESWLEIRVRLGHDASRDGCLQLQPLADGTFAPHRIEAGQMTEWLRHLLEGIGVERSALRNVGSHSCKASLLSLAAKAGLSRDTRRLLGGHSPPNDKTVEVYARDVLATPMRELGNVVLWVRSGVFLPDASRSGRWRAPEEMRQNHPDEPLCPKCGKPLSSAEYFRCACGNGFHSGAPCSIQCDFCGEEMCGTCDESGVHCCEAPDDEIVSDGDDSSSDDSDCEHAAMAAEDADEAIAAEEAETVEFLSRGTASGSDAAFPKDGITLHKFLGTCHRANKDGMPACGVKGLERNFELHFSPEAMLDQALCWRPGCAPLKKR